MAWNSQGSQGSSRLTLRDEACGAPDHTAGDGAIACLAACDAWSSERRGRFVACRYPVYVGELITGQRANVRASTRGRMGHDVIEPTGMKI